jgi:hypothetical protein
VRDNPCRADPTDLVTGQDRVDGRTEKPGCGSVGGQPERGTLYPDCRAAGVGDPRFGVEFDDIPGGWPGWRRAFKQAAAVYYRKGVPMGGRVVGAASGSKGLPLQPPAMSATHAVRPLTCPSRENIFLEKDLRELGGRSSGA